MHIAYVPAPAGLLPEGVLAAAIQGDDSLHILIDADASIEDACGAMTEAVEGLLAEGCWTPARPHAVAS